MKFHGNIKIPRKGTNSAARLSIQHPVKNVGPNNDESVMS